MTEVSVAFSPFFCSQDLDYREVVVVETRVCGHAVSLIAKAKGSEGVTNQISEISLGLGLALV